MSATISTHITPDDRYAMPDGEQYELIDGQLVEKTVSREGAWVASQLITRIQIYLDTHPIGDVFSESAGYRCFSFDGNRVRKPDLSFILNGRMTAADWECGFPAVVPDLVVEVLSPQDLAYDVFRKLEDYFSVGVPLVWVLNPETRTATVYRQGGTEIRHYHEQDSLTDDLVLPGFSYPLAKLFRPKAP